MIANPFRNRIIRDWVFDQVETRTPLPKAIATTGSGPFPEGEFDDFLRRFGMRPRGVGADVGSLIVGRNEWSESELRALLRARSGRSLRVYSQEMFMSFLLTGRDPLDAAKSVLDQFGRSHPALIFLTAVGFDWPSTRIVGTGGSALAGDWGEVGYLKYMGYRVGRSGLSERDRRARLRRAYYLRDIPEVFRDEWGRKRSSVRLQKMANCLAAFCRLHGRKPENDLAVRQWIDDLAWLRQTYFDGHYRFEWPSTNVW